MARGKIRKEKAGEKAAETAVEPADAGFADFLELASFLILTALLVFIPLLFARGTKSNFILPKQLFFEPVVAIALLAWGAGMLFRGRIRIASTKAYLPAALFLLIAAVSVFFSSVPYEGVKALMAMFAAAVAGFLVANLYGTTRRALILLGAMLFVACVEAVWGLTQARGIALLFKVSEEAVGTLGNSNYFGAYMALFLPLAVSLGLAGFTYTRNSAYRVAISILAGEAAILLAVAMIVSECQGAYIGAGIALVVMAMAWTARNTKRLKVLMIAAVCSVTVIAFSIGVASLLGKLPLSRMAHLGDRAVGGRILMWEASMGMVADRPLVGVGIGNYQYNYIYYLGPVVAKKDVSRIKNIIQNAEKPHNAYIQIWSETGTLGLLAFLGLLAVFLFGRLKAFRNIGKEWEFWVHMGIVAGFIGYCAVLFVSSLLMITPMREVLWVFMGLTMAWERAVGTPERVDFERDISAGNGWRKVALVLLLAVLPATWYASAMRRSLAEYRANVLWKDGMYLAGGGKLPEAIKTYSRALDYTPGDMKLLFYRGSALVKFGETVGDRDIGRELLERGVSDLLRARRGYSDINLLSNLGKAYTELGELDKAVEYYGEAADTGLKYATSHMNYGVALMTAERLDEARGAMEKALDAAPNDARMIFFLGTILLKQGRFAEAEEQLRVATEKLKTNPEAYSNLGLALLGRDKFGEAVKYFKLALELNGDNTGYRNNLAIALYRQGRKEEAAAQWRKVLEIDPDNPQAKTNLENWKIESGQ